MAAAPSKKEKEELNLLDLELVILLFWSYSSQKANQSIWHPFVSSPRGPVRSAAILMTRQVAASVDLNITNLVDFVSFGDDWSTYDT